MDLASKHAHLGLSAFRRAVPGHTVWGFKAFFLCLKCVTIVA